MQPQVNIFSFVLEDDPETLEMVESILRANGIHDYRLFTTASDLLSNLTADIHVCLIDHYLPAGVTGLDVLKAIKQTSTGSFVIVMTGQRSFDVVVEYLNNCADRYIDKNKHDSMEWLEKYMKIGIDEARKRAEEKWLLKQRIKERNEVFKKLDL